MKKKILSLGAVIAICLGVCTFSVSQSNVELSTLALDNVEALAGGEWDVSGFNDTDCWGCKTSSGYPGAKFVCSLGESGCVVTTCQTGTCG